jgi:gluconate kinase
MERLTEENAKLLILFGRPGAGKETVAGVLREEHGYFFHNGDKDNTPAMRANLAENAMHTIPQRDEHARIMIERLHELRELHSRLALKQALVLERHRAMLHEAFPQATFLYVVSPEDKTEIRVAARAIERGHHVSPLYAARVGQIYEEPQLPHIKIYNDVDGLGGIINQLNLIIP